MTINNFFVPNRQTITSITRANPGVVTTSQNHGYLSGLFVRFYYPPRFGMIQVYGPTYQITVLTPTTFDINADTSNFDTFAILSTSQVPQVIPVGEVTNILTMAIDNNNNIISET